MSAPEEVVSAVPAAPCGWVKMYHPTGALVTLPVFGQWKEKVKGWDYAAAFSAVSDAVAVGFTVNAPGLEVGEQREEIGYVLRREKENKDKSLTPLIDLYSKNDAVQYKVLSEYLNNDEAIAEFESVSGFHIANLKVFPGAAALKRDGSKTANDYIAKAPRPFAVVMKANPKYDEKEAEAFAARKETYKVPKRIFVRWEGQAPAPPKEKPSSVSTVIHQPTVDEWKKFIGGDPTADKLNDRYSELQHINCKYTLRAVKGVIYEYTQREGIEFDANAKKFVAPRLVTEREANDQAVEEAGYRPF